MQLQSGTLLQGGKYKIERVLGQGGFGITYLATQELFDRRVCIKEFFFNDYCERGSQGEVTSCTTNSKELVDRFLNKFIKEARTISRLDHPNIVRILDIFQENGTAYYAMEYIEGCSLADKVNKQGALSEAVAVDYIKQVASALDYIHQRSINHLDVKPANIMVRQSDNKAILIDFGLSKQYDEQGGQTSTTPVGISHGYAPMEQYNQGGVSTFSPQTDIYALGATLYKLVTGNTPPQAIEIFNEGLTGFPQSLSPNLVAAIKKTMQPKKGDRPQSIGEFMGLLEGDYTSTSTSSTRDQSEIDESTRVIGTSDSEPAKNISSPQPTIAMMEEAKKGKGIKVGVVTGIVLVCIITFILFDASRGSYDSQAVSPSLYSIQDQVLEPKSTINGHEYVDLGLSVKWATCNIGAREAHEYGNHYAWGISDAGETVDYANHPLKDINQNYTLPSKYDSATKLWGTPWRMPTVYEFEELINNCKWSWITINGYNGYKIIGPNDNYIFLPAAGSTAFDCGEKNVYGLYWSSSMRKAGEWEDSHNWYLNKRLYFKKGQFNLSNGHGPQVAMSIRPVID